MQLDDLGGAALVDAAHVTLADDIERSALHRALLAEPVAVPLIADASGERVVRLPDAPAPSPLVESLPLGAHVLACYATASALREDALTHDFWPDGVERAKVYARGALFKHIKSHPGALLVVDGGRVALDAGEVAALADGLTPSDVLGNLQKFVASGRGRDAAKQLAGRMVYVLGHPSGGMVMFQRELPVFLHRRHADDFATRMAAQMGRKPDRALVAVAEIFQYAVRGKLAVLVAPGPAAVRLRYLDVR